MEDIELYHPILDRVITVPVGAAWVHERSGWEAIEEAAPEADQDAPEASEEDEYVLEIGEI